MSKYLNQFYPGAIKSYEEIYDLISECAETNSSISIYSVMQSGYMQEYVLTQFSAIINYRMFDRNYPCLVFDTRTWNFLDDRANPSASRIFMDDRGIGYKGQLTHAGCHQTFVSKKIAEDFSNWMKTDHEYKAEVIAHHKRCDDLTRDLGLDY